MLKKCLYNAYLVAKETNLRSNCDFWGGEVETDARAIVHGEYILLYLAEKQCPQVALRAAVAINVLEILASLVSSNLRQPCSGDD